MVNALLLIGGNVPKGIVKNHTDAKEIKTTDIVNLKKNKL